MHPRDEYALDSKMQSTYVGLHCTAAFVNQLASLFSLHTIRLGDNNEFYQVPRTAVTTIHSNSESQPAPGQALQLPIQV